MEEDVSTVILNQPGYYPGEMLQDGIEQSEVVRWKGEGLSLHITTSTSGFHVWDSRWLDEGPMDDGKGDFGIGKVRCLRGKFRRRGPCLTPRQDFPRIVRPPTAPFIYTFATAAH